MFDLTEEINKWSAALQSTSALSEEDVQEMRSHLVATIDDLVSDNLSEQESFMVATHRLGHINALQSEYSKVNVGFVWRKRLIWLISGYLLFSLVPFIAQLLTFPVYLLQMEPLLFPSRFLFGDDFPLPYPVHAVFLFLLTALLISLSRNKGKVHSWIKIGKLRSRLIMILIFGFVAAQFITTASFVRLSSFSSPELVGQISASASFFSIIWRVFIVTALIFLVSLQFKQNRLQPV